jgi:hypothetical protein
MRFSWGWIRRCKLETKILYSAEASPASSTTLTASTQEWITKVSYFMSRSSGSTPRQPEFVPGSGHVGFEVDKAALGQIFSKYFRSPANNSNDCLTLITVHHHPGLVSTNCRTRILLEKLTVAQLIKNFPESLWNTKFHFWSLTQ